MQRGGRQSQMIGRGRGLDGGGAGGVIFFDRVRDGEDRAQGKLVKN